MLVVSFWLLVRRDWFAVACDVVPIVNCRLIVGVRVRVEVCFLHHVVDGLFDFWVVVLCCLGLGLGSGDMHIHCDQHFQ